MKAGEPAAVAVTGASGFVGSAAVQALSRAGLHVRAISRKPKADADIGQACWSAITDYRDTEALRQALADARCVIHLADRSDRSPSRTAGESAATAASLVRAMAAVGASRLVLASSVYARLERPGGYGAAKRAAEAEVLAAAGLQAVILRMPPVYGPGGGGGFGMLAALVRRGLPLPFARAVAPRAYLSRRNLCDLLVSIVCADAHQWAAAAGNCFEPFDGEPVGTADLVRMLALASGRHTRQIPVPLPVLRALGRITGRGTALAGALDPLQVAGNEPLARLFGWTPAERMPESLGFLRAAA